MSPRLKVKVLHLVGARPNLVKMAPVLAALEAWNIAATDAQPVFDQVLVHTGQHYDEALSQVFFRDLGLREPVENLGVGSGSQAAQLARLLEAIESVMLRYEPDLVVVPGDVNSTCAGALVAAKLDVPIVHLEAGLRSGDRSMPEEINRIVTDHLSELLLATCDDAVENLRAEGLLSANVALVGNTMIDSLVRLLPAARETTAGTRRRLGVGEGPFALVTLHRPSNVDEPRQLSRLLSVLARLSADVPVVFPVHPRTRARLQAVVAGEEFSRAPWLFLCEPLGYLEFLGLLQAAAVVVTDSGGVQEETSVVGTPCVTVRDTTERPVTVTLGTNVLVDPHDADAVLAACGAALGGGRASPPPGIPLWDGAAGPRVAAALAVWVTDRLAR